MRASYTASYCYEGAVKAILANNRMYLYTGQALRRAGLGDAQAARLGAWAQQLHAAVERMANVKEYRCAPRWHDHRFQAAAVALLCACAASQLQTCPVGCCGFISGSCLSDARTAGKAGSPAMSTGVCV